MAQDLGMGIDTRVSPSFHPQIIASLDEFDDDTRVPLQQVVDAFTSVYEGFGKVHDAKEAAVANSAWTEDMRVIKLQEAADRAFARFAPQLDKVFGNMRNSVAMLEKELSAPVEARAAHTISTSIREHVKGLAQHQGGSTVDKRGGVSAVGFVQAAIQKGDEVTASAVLGAPPYLSGLTDEMHALLLRQWHEKVDPARSKRIRAMRAAMEIIQDRGARIHVELEKLVGKPPAYAKMLRDRNAAAEKAFGGI